MNLIIFGASGDLAKRKLFPALAKLNIKNTKIIGFARTHYDKPFSEVLKNFYTYDDDSFCDRIKYIQGKSYTDLEVLKPYLNSETIIYLSLPPEVYLDTLKVLSKYEYGGIAVEKPFGSSYEDFLQFKKYPIEKLYFIDHFILKPLIVSWAKLINSNNKLKTLIDKKYIKNVKVIFKEEIGGEGRGYFDTHGLVKDVVQNHLSELLAVVSIDKRIESCDRQSEERVHLFQNTKIIEELSLFGQYNEYCHEMSKPSLTETFSIVTLQVNVDKWKDVPFITIAGKGMNEKKTEIIFEFKKEAIKQALDLVDNQKYENVQSVRIVCNLAPENEVYLEVVMEDSIKRHVIFPKSEIIKHMREKYGNYENHEIVFDSFINNHKFDLVKFSEAELLWKIYRCILDKEKPLFYYSKGSEIPKEAKKLLEEIEERY